MGNRKLKNMLELIPCLHIGLANSYAEIIWNSIYRLPSPTNDDVCDYPLARNESNFCCD